MLSDRRRLKGAEQVWQANCCQDDQGGGQRSVREIKPWRRRSKSFWGQATRCSHAA